MLVPSVDKPPALFASCGLLFDRNPAPMWVFDPQTLRMLAVNDAALAQYGYTREAFLALVLPDLFHADQVDRLLGALKRPAIEWDPQMPWLLLRASGEPFEVEIVIDELQFDSVKAHVALAKELTSQRQAQECLLEERETLRTVVDTTTDAIINVDQQGNIKTFNPGAEKIFHQTCQSMLGQSIEMLLPERYRAEHVRYRDAFAGSGVKSRTMGLSRVKGLRADGEELDLEGTISQVTVDQKKTVVVCLRDVTRRVRSDLAFERSRAQLADLTQKLMQQERMLVRRLAQTLHDQLGQTIAAIRMMHETIVTLQSDKPPCGVKRLQTQMGMLIGQAVGQVRQVLMDLRPALLEELGLAAALDNELRVRSLSLPEFDISIEVQPEVALMRWPNEVEYAAFMVAREAVENALRHSGATSITARLTGTAASLQLQVVDDGVGMSTGTTPQTGHLGVLGMSERAQAVGAVFSVDSGQGFGTRVGFSWRSSP